MLPDESTLTPLGFARIDAVAVAPSPENPSAPLPAMVAIRGASDHADALIVAVGDIDVSATVDGEGSRSQVK
jgi:hypothetical protein